MKILNNIFLIIAPFILLNILIKRLYIFRESPNILELSSYQLTLYVYITIILVCLFIINLLKKFNNNDMVFHNYIFIIYEKYYQALVKFESLIYSNILKYFGIDTRRFVSKFVNYIRASRILKKNMYFVINIPKIILAIIFIINVIEYNNFTYFYYFTPLLLIPLSLNYIIYRLKEEYQAGFNRIKDLVDIIDKSSRSDIKFVNNNSILLQTVALEVYILNRTKNIYDDNLVLVLSLKTFENVLRNQKIDVKATTVKYTRFVELLIETKTIINNINFMKTKYDFIINNICYLLYIIGWLYILIINFF